MDAIKKFHCRVLQGVSLLALCASAALGVSAQGAARAERWTALAETVFHHVGRTDKLPSSLAFRALTQDAAGFVWVGTENGLARWDGYRLRIYKSDPASDRTLPANLISRLYTDSRGQLWIGTFGAGLARYDYDHDDFVRYAAGPDGLSGVHVWDITDDGAGGVWVASEGGLDRVLPEDGSVSHLGHNERDPGSLPVNLANTALRGRDGTLWVGTVAGLVRRGPGDRAFVPVPLPTPDGKVAQAWRLFEDTRQRLWIGTHHSGAYVIDPRDMSARQILGSNPQDSTLRTEEVRGFVEVRPEEVWIGTHEGIFAVDTIGFRTRRIRHDPLFEDSLADNTVDGLYKDRSGLVWINTSRGVSLYDPSREAVYTIAGAAKGRHYDSLEHQVALLQMPDGRLWLGDERNGIDILDPVGVRTAGLRSDPDRPKTGLPAGVIHMFALAESGDVYVGTEAGLYRVDPLARRATRLILAGRDPTANVNALLSQKGVLWVGGSDGLWEVDAGSAKEAARTAPPSRRVEGLSDSWVNVLAYGPEGSLWIGTTYGLNRFDPASRAVERILPDARDPGALAGSIVSTLLTDRLGRLWVGTGQGISVLQGRGHDGRPRFRHLGVAQGLINDSIDMLLADRRGQIWASTDDGLALIDPDSFKIRSLRVAEGVAIPGYWAGVGAITDAGELVFGGLDGLTVVQPDRLKPWAYQPPVVVTEAHIGGKWVPSSHLNPGSRLHEPLTITPGGNSIAIEFAALDYSAPERNRYAYKLDGFDTDWTETDSDHRLAAYTNLPPGDYLLRLRGSNRDGVWTDAGLTVPVRVLPAWFQTVAFNVLAGFVLLGLLVLAYRLRMRYMAARLQERHRGRLAERDRIARELHDTLLQSTEGLILKVHSVVNQLSARDPQHALLSAALDRASELAYEGRERIQGLREGAPPRAEIGQVLEKAAREMVQGTEMRFELQLEGRVRVLRPYIWEELYRIGYEALWNAYRHARASLISVAVSYGERELFILISDDGRGITSGTLQSAVAGGHFGLAGMRERARGMKARLHIESSEGGGTRVEIRINSLLSYAAP